MNEKSSPDRLTGKERFKVWGVSLGILVVFGFVGALMWQLNGPQAILRLIEQAYQRGEILQMLGGVAGLVFLWVVIPFALVMGLIGFVQGLLGWRTRLTRYLAEEQQRTMAQVRLHEAQAQVKQLGLDDAQWEIVEEAKRTLEEAAGVITPEERERVESMIRDAEAASARERRAAYWKRNKWAWIMFVGIGPALFLVCLLLMPGGPIIPLRAVPIQWNLVLTLGAGIGLGISMFGMRSVIKSAEYVIVPTWVGLVILGAILAVVIGIIALVAFLS